VRGMEIQKERVRKRERKIKRGRERKREWEKRKKERKRERERERGGGGKLILKRCIKECEISSWPEQLFIQKKDQFLSATQKHF
jgi:hypothetical protein